ncbi:putative TOS1-like glycosyl hydrolase-domain-containing protein [Hypoxylon trugodes]|uniref:putative TOS1-like glycosyl hydrolase-domain-containing protein n=1 Tax=Hypoxylon trugodes TaxID=326681 RepID=UPI002194970C|nr:putative TOS1-like glycosyl hydrolase-domain-containing protein [Hypoxylon trugodes]KAI1392782.1 putative TOS1-like glycosyl hydrolase-domain-containing protein [Hypoxylon trugodes]
MKYSSAIILAAVTVANADCSAFEEFGNFFCKNAVKQIKYNGLDLAGKYRAVASMDNSGTCTFEDKDYSGPIAPFDEDLTLHFRGPLKLETLAVYTPSSSSSKRDVPKPHSKRHGHQHLHKKYHEHEAEKRADMVSAYIDGKLVSWENNYFGPSTTPAPAATAAVASAYNAVTSAAESIKSKVSSAVSSSSSVPAGDYERVAYYNAKDQTADGLVFLANLGDPSLSGTWDTVWGSSLAYSNEDGTKAAASPTVLKDATISDDVEIIVASDKECKDDCGTVRPGAVAYKGFEGANKVFLLKFSMPLSGDRSFNGDMPAVWALNGKIPRTGQYSKCSCWSGDNASPQQGGCGEADIFEVLRSGDTKAKSTFHFAAGIGDSHYFDRPTDVNSPVTVAVVFQESTSSTTIKVLDDSYDIGTSLTSDQIEDIVKDETDLDLFSLMSFALS